MGVGQRPLLLADKHFEGGQAFLALSLLDTCPLLPSELIAGIREHRDNLLSSMLEVDFMNKDSRYNRVLTEDVASSGREGQAQGHQEKGKMQQKRKKGHHGIARQSRNASKVDSGSIGDDSAAVGDGQQVGLLSEQVEQAAGPLPRMLVRQRFPYSTTITSDVTATGRRINCAGPATASGAFPLSLGGRARSLPQGHPVNRMLAAVLSTAAGFPSGSPMPQAGLSSRPASSRATGRGRSRQQSAAEPPAVIDLSEEAGAAALTSSLPGSAASMAGVVGVRPTWQCLSLLNDWVLTLARAILKEVCR
jgi:hypothetical protein